MANDKHVFVATYALTNPAQVAYSDGHRIPAGWTGTVVIRWSLRLIIQSSFYLLSKSYSLVEMDRFSI